MSPSPAQFWQYDAQHLEVDPLLGRETDMDGLHQIDWFKDAHSCNTISMVYYASCTPKATLWERTLDQRLGTSKCHWRWNKARLSWSLATTSPTDDCRTAHPASYDTNRIQRGIPSRANDSGREASTCGLQVLITSYPPPTSPLASQSTATPTTAAYRPHPCPREPWRPTNSCL